MYLTGGANGERPHIPALPLFFVVGLLLGAAIAGTLVGNYNQEGLLSSYREELTVSERDLDIETARAGRLDLALTNARMLLEQNDASLYEADLRILEFKKEASEVERREWLEKGQEVTGRIVGVDREGGVVIPVSYELREGKGRLLVNLEGAFFLLDAQDSIKTAYHVASDFSGVDIADADLIVTIRNPTSGTVTLEGPSAGAVMALDMIALMSGKRPRDDVFVTGGIDESGTILPVGGIEVKAEAVRSANATLLMVPKGQKVEVHGLEVVETPTIRHAVELMFEE